MKLYKYTDWKIGCKTIESSSITLSKPETFNDPFDCLPASSNDADLKKAIEILNGYIIEQMIYNAMEGFKNKLGNPLQKAWLSSVAWGYRLAQSLYKKHPTPYKPFLTFNRFYDMYNACVKLGKISPEQKQIIEQMKEAQAKLEGKEWETLNQIVHMRDSLYVGCLSKLYDSILMWSYYADKHKGLCFELEINEPKALSEVKYSDERPTVQMEAMMKDICGSLFAQGITFEKNYDILLPELVLQPYITKANSWRHEEEYRLIFLEEVLKKRNLTPQMCDDGVERYFYDVKITKVFLGAAMSEEQKAEIRAKVPSDIEVVEMKISDSKYELLY